MKNTLEMHSYRIEGEPLECAAYLASFGHYLWAVLLISMQN